MQLNAVAAPSGTNMTAGGAFNGAEEHVQPTRNGSGSDEELPASVLPGLMAATHARHEAICAHLHQAFQTGAFSDLRVHVPAFQLAFNLHTVVVSASPLFRHLLMVSATTAAAKPHPAAASQSTQLLNGLPTPDVSVIASTGADSPGAGVTSADGSPIALFTTSPPSHAGPPFELTLRPEDPNITEDGLCLALAHLYSAGALHRLSPSNARAVLAAAWWLGLEDLCASATAVCRADIRADTIGIYSEFVEDSLQDSDELTGLSVDMTAATNMDQLPDRYGIYSRAIRDTVFAYLCDRLLEDLRSLSNSREVLLRTLATLRYAWFKRLMETAQFRCGTDIERYRLAKEAVQLRKQLRVGLSGGDREESVILAFGQSQQGGRVAVVRKPPRSSGQPIRERVLWRVPGMPVSTPGTHPA